MADAKGSRRVCEGLALRLGLDELLAFNPALLDVHEVEEARAERAPACSRASATIKGSIAKGREHAQYEEEHEGVVVVVPGRSDDRRRHEGPDERGRLPHDGEEREEQEPAGQRGWSAAVAA